MAMKKLSSKHSKQFRPRSQTAVLRYPLGCQTLVAEECNELLQSLSSQSRAATRLTLEKKQITVSKTSLRTLAELSLRSLCADDFLLELAQAPVRFESELGDFLEKQEFSAFLPPEMPLHIRCVSKSSRLFHTGLLEEYLQKALQAHGFQVVEAAEAQSTIELRLQRNKATLLISLAGESLHKRNYRKTMRHIAPLNECLAACAIRFARQFFSNTFPEKTDDHSALYLPFAGSGTLGFEAILNYYKFTPALFRSQYAVELIFPELARSCAHIRKKGLWLPRDAESGLSDPSPTNLSLEFLDADPTVLHQLKENTSYFSEQLMTSQLETPPLEMNCVEGDFFSHLPDAKGKEFLAIFCNPPYGARLKVPHDFTKRVYRRLAEIQAQTSATVWGFVFTPSAYTVQKKDIPFNTTQRLALRHGGLAIDCLAFSF